MFYSNQLFSELFVDRCLKYVAENAEEVMYTPSWADLDQNILILIVQRDDLQVSVPIVVRSKRFAFLAFTDKLEMQMQP